MTRRQAAAGVLLAGIAVALLGFFTPVSSGSHSCGVAGPWATALGGDPTGPGDLPDAYAEYNACADATRQPVYVLLGGLFLPGAGAADLALVRRR